MRAGIKDELELNTFQRDALNELGNIASCHAVTALAEMTGLTMEIEVPKVEVVAVEEIHRLIELDKIVAGILVELEGDLSGYLQVLFPARSAFMLIDMLMGREIGETKGIETDMERSALMETGNILASSFCSAIADFFHTSLIPSPPSFACDMMGAMVGDTIIRIAQVEMTERVILFRCDFRDEAESTLYGYILLFPNPERLDGILDDLQAMVDLEP